MKIVDNILSRLGTDKVLHFLVGALLPAWGFIVSGGYGEAMIVLVIVLSVLKEILDDKMNWKDILAAVLGCVLTTSVYLGIRVLL